MCIPTFCSVLAMSTREEVTKGALDVLGIRYFLSNLTFIMCPCTVCASCALTLWIVVAHVPLCHKIFFRIDAVFWPLFSCRGTLPWWWGNPLSRVISHRFVWIDRFLLLFTRTSLTGCLCTHCRFFTFFHFWYLSLFRIILLFIFLHVLSSFFPIWFIRRQRTLTLLVVAHELTSSQVLHECQQEICIQRGCTPPVSQVKFGNMKGAHTY